MYCQKSIKCSVCNAVKVNVQLNAVRFDGKFYYLKPSY